MGAWIRQNLYFYAHPTGSARLSAGALSEGVLNTDLRVRGVENVRVCDASAIGKLIVGHSDGPTRMVGANCAQMIMEKERAEMPYAGYGTNFQVRAFHIQYFLNQGGRLIDTAASYEKASVVAQGVGQSDTPREKAFIVTKIGPEEFDDVYGAIKRHVAEFKGTTKNGEEVQLDYVDLVLLHWPRLYDTGSQTPPKCAQHKDKFANCHRVAWQGMERAVQEGLTRFIGVSNFAVRHLKALYDWEDRKYPIYANQIEYHPFITNAWREAREFCHERGIRVMAYGVVGGLKQGMYIEDEAIQKASKSEEFKSYIMEKLELPDSAVTPENVMFQWGLDQGVTVLQGSRRKTHMDQLLRMYPGGFPGEILKQSDIEAEFRDKAYQPDAAAFDPDQETRG